MSATFTPNPYLGLSEGPIDIKSSSVVNAIFSRSNNFTLLIGDAVFLDSPVLEELLPRVDFIGTIQQQEDRFYGIAVAGDVGGVYQIKGSGETSVDPNSFPRIATQAGQGVRVCTQGRCIARILQTGGVTNIGDPLTPSVFGTLKVAISGIM